MSKVLIHVLFSFGTFHLILSASNSVRTRQEDAQQVFQDYLDLSRKLISDVMTNVNYREWQRNQELEILELQTNYTIDKKIGDINLKISQLQNILKPWNITRCQVSQLSSYQTKLKERAQQCTKLTSGAIRNLVQKTTHDVTSLQNNLMGCYARSLSFCGSFATNDSCYDFVISNIETAKANMVTNFELIRSNFESKIISMKLPCQDLIEFELSVYPEYYVQYISQCGETDIKNTRPKVCPF